LDETANSEATEFQSGTSAYVRQFPSGNFDLFINVGTVRKKLENARYLIAEEVVTFTNSKRGVLDYDPVDTVLYRWVGNNPGIPRFSGRIVHLPTEAYAVLLCTYTTSYDQLEVFYSGNEETNILLAATRETVDDDGETEYLTGSILISYKVDDLETRPVILTLSDYCSDDIISGATIILSGPGYTTTEFTTDALGQAHLGNLTVGVTYDIKITATGYRDSDLDSLSNDSFTVTAETS
jgi:hypothetical protein